MIIEINGRDYKLDWTHGVYAFVLFLFPFYILRDLSYNTAFVDEAIYATVGEEFLRGIFWESALSWMGGSYLYPALSALINRLLGLAGIRFFSFLCVFVAGIVSGEIARKIAGRHARVFAVSIFFASSIVLNMSALGTYDAPAILFLALTSLVAIHSKGRVHLILLSSFLFLLSVLSKYIAVLFAPFLLLLVMERTGDRLLRGLIWASPFIIGLSLYALYNLESLINFFTSDSFTETKERFFILSEVVNHLNIFLLSPLAIFVKRKKLYLLTVLSLAGLMPLFYHLAFANFRSLWKHLVFTQFFWAPLLAGIFVFIYAKLKATARRKVIFNNASQLVYSGAIGLCVFGLWVSASNHWRFQRSWPSASPALDYLARVRKPGDKIFAEGSAVYKYHLFDGFVDPLSWTSTWYIEYQGRTGVEAMKKAIEDRAFDYIVLNGYYTREVSDELSRLADNYYMRVHTDSYKVSGEYDTLTVVWGRRGS